ncbi:transcriptional regulator, TetR family [Haloechinothrix alba]|uniref:Transcriptional regulator, TetR family n=1 Tax=Haloechinothrix alba TaxID=664784 RepID=A0A239A244_9PSEU|nr:TetR/AcrR family transcriptional regulator [Haloechinothrix alba]SNR89482.1 transcriptional regulator, TetR family [Haloechinothrix alba]
MSNDIAQESTRRRLSPKQADMVRRLTAAAEEELLATGYASLTVRNVAGRAGVAPATAYTYFSSKNHLIAELFWRKLQTLPDGVDESVPPQERVISLLREIALLMAGEPELAAACTSALLGSDPDVALLRIRVGSGIRDRLEEALGEGFDPEVRDALEFAYAGALVQAGMGATSYERIADRLASTAGLIMGRSS